MPGPTHLKLTGSFNSSLSSSLLIRRLSKFNDEQDLNLKLSETTLFEWHQLAHKQLPKKKTPPNLLQEEEEECR